MIYAWVVLTIFVVLWGISVALFSGVLSLNWLPEPLATLTVPSSFEGLGNAMATLDGLLSSVAIVLGLIAVLFQGRELKASTDAQRLQTEALTHQLAQQALSNQLGAYSARLQFLLAEIEHLETRVAKQVEAVKAPNSSKTPEEVSQDWTLIKNMRQKIERYRKEANRIDAQLKQELEPALSSGQAQE